MNRRGIALLVAIMALGSLAVITATAASLAQREAVLGREALATLKARAAAESALGELAGGFGRELLPVWPGDSTVLPSNYFVGGTARVVVRSLGGPIFAFEATGVVTGAAGLALARVRLELLARVDSAGPDSLLRPRPIPRGWRQIP
jgi:hypothetical protein